MLFRSERAKRVIEKSRVVKLAEFSCPSTAVGLAHFGRAHGVKFRPCAPQGFDAIRAVELAAVLQRVIGCRLGLVNGDGLGNRASGGAECRLTLLLHPIAQAELRRCENICLKAFAKNLAVYFHSAKIGACADVLHQVWNFRE